jgi:hypothetical protein
MTTNLSLKNRTTSHMPKERAPSMRSQTSDSQQKLRLHTAHNSKSIDGKAQVKRIAERYTSRAPRSTQKASRLKNASAIESKIVDTASKNQNAQHAK